MNRPTLCACLLVSLGSCCLAQQSSSSPPSSGTADRNQEAQESSSRETRIYISPPKDDAKNHPSSSSAVADLDVPDHADTSGVEEFHPWNPMKAARDVDVGDYYFKRKN